MPTLMPHRTETDVYTDAGIDTDTDIHPDSDTDTKIGRDIRDDSNIIPTTAHITVYPEKTTHAPRGKRLGVSFDALGLVD